MLFLATAAGALAAAVVASVRPDLAARLPHRVSWAAALAGAAAIGAADAAPTGWAPFDLVLRTGFGALVPLAASRAGTVTSTWLTVAAVAALVVVDAPAGTVAGVAAGAGLALGAAGLATPGLAAVTAAAVTAPLAHADWPVATGASAAAVAAVTVPLLISAWLRTAQPRRSHLAWAVAVVGLAMLVGTAAGLGAALSARTEVDRAVALAADGIVQLGDGDDEAGRALQRAASSFASADGTLSAWWAKPALLVPGVAQHARALSTMASTGAELAQTAARATTDADIAGIRPIDGRVDLEAVAALARPLHRSLASMHRADDRLAAVDSPLLVRPLADRLDELRTEIARAVDRAELAAHAVEVVPGMLGAHGPRRYFLAVQNPAELRGNGGYIGSWAELVADGGRVSLVRTGRNRDLTAAAPPVEQRVLLGEAEAVRAWTPYLTDWVSVNFTPDHPTMSRVVAQLHRMGGGGELDGVIAITPHALPGFLELTGPIEVDGYPDALEPSNVARALLFDQYLHFAGDKDQREEFLSEVVEVLFDRLSDGALPGPRRIGEALASAVDGRHLQLWSAHAAEQQLFERFGADGDVRRDGVDAFGVVGQNFGGNKLDYFLHRSVTQAIRWDPGTGAVHGTITAQLRNDAPTSGLPNYILGSDGDPRPGAPRTGRGDNFMLLSLYSTFPVERVTVDGRAVPFERFTELGHQVVRLHLVVPAQGDREVVADVRGVVARSSRYAVRPLRQPTVHPDQLRATVRLAPGWEIAAITGGRVTDAGTAAVARGNAARPMEMAVEVEQRDADRTWLDRLRGDG